MLVITAFCSVPGLQPAGAALGFVAGVVQVIKMAVDALKDPMRECIFKLIDDLLAKTWRWDKKTVLVQRIGLAADLAKLRADFDGSGLGVLEVDSMADRGVQQQRLNEMYRRLDTIGIEPRNARYLISFSLGVSDFHARGLAKP